MSDEFEQRLSLELQDRVPQPPRVCTAQDIRDRSPELPARGHVAGARIAAVVAAVAFVALVATLLSLHAGTYTDRAGQPAARSASSTTSTPGPRGQSDVITDPRALVGPTWTLQTYRPASGASVHVRPGSGPTITFAANGVIEDNLCDTATSTLDAGRIVIHQPFVNGLVARSCGPGSRAALSDDVQTVLAVGTVRWSIAADTLTITRPAEGVLVLQAGRDATIAGRLLLVGGPAPGRPKPIAGSIVLQMTNGRNTVHASTTTDGRFSVDVVAGRWTVTGQTSRSSGEDCVTDAAVNARAGRTTHVDVLCQVP